MKFRKFGTGRTSLLIIAGIVWIIAGSNILKIGIVTWNYDAPNWLSKVGEASVIFLLFFTLVFRRLYYKHTKRIERKNDKNCPFSFFDSKGWVIMAFMITWGIVIRKFKLLPNSFISVFYTGLSLALIVTGFLFLRQGWQRYCKNKK